MTTPAPGTAAPTGEAAPVTPATEAAPAPAAPAAPATPAPETPAVPTVTEPAGKAPKFEGEFDPAKFERLVENLRGEVATEREKRTAAEKSASEQAAQQQADLVKKFAAAFGLPGGEEAKPPTVEELTKQLTDSRAETEKTAALARQRDVELAVYKSAGTAGGDADALLDSRSFLTSIKGLDPTASTFADDVAAAVKKAVDGNPKLALKQPEAPPAPARGGADLTGTPGGKRQLTGAEVKRMTPDQIDQARKAGQLRDYLSGPG